MNLAIHDIPLFRSLNFRGTFASFSQRGITPWITPETRRNWSGLEPYLDSGALLLYDIADKHSAFFETFKQQYKRPLAAREAKMLYLAEHSGSVLLTEESVVIEGAKSHNLNVWSGDIRELDQYFPIRSDLAVSDAQASVPPEAASSGECKIILSTEFPTDRRVPDRTESLCVSRDESRAGRGGSPSPIAVHAA